MASSTARIMEKPGQDQLQQQQQALKCPRCDSSNTKFCYYNNYSLSQPRHFCKACKRYWTRGGTLRNVPVGGGCRKNKRVKRPNSSSSSSSVADHHHHHHHNNNLGASNNSSSSSSPNSLLHGNTPSSLSSSALQPGQIDLSTAPNHHLSPLFYGLANNINSTIPSDISLPFSSRFGSTASGFDLLQPQLNSLGLGFSSGNNSTILSSTTTTDHHNNYNQNGFSSNSSLLSSYSSIFSSPSSASASPTIASLLASKFTNGGGTAGLKDHTFVLSARGSNHNFPSLLSSPFEELQITGNNGEPGTAGLMKHVKLEDGQRRLDWDGVHNCSAQNDHQTVEQNIGLSSSSSDPSNSLNYWSNPTAVGGANWLDPGNIGSSVPSLI